MDYIEFSAKIKEKYPEYKDIDDLTLAQKIVEKYPEYKEKVTFKEEKKTNKFVNPFTASKEEMNNVIKQQNQELLNNRQEWEKNHPIISRLQADYQPGYRAERTDMENKAQYGLEAPAKETIKSLLAQAGRSTVPYINAGRDAALTVLTKGKQGFLPQLGKAAAIGAIQGGTSEALDELSNNGLNANILKRGVEGAGYGGGGAAGIAALLEGIPYIGKAVSKPLNYIGKKAVEGLTDVKPETIAQVIKPTSKALDLTEGSAQNLLMNTTEGIRNNYADLLNKKGDTVGNLLKELPKDKAFNSEALTDLYDSILNNYSLSKNAALNPARNATSKEINKIAALLNGNETKTVNPQELYDINKNISNMIDWDKPGAALKNDVLEQIYLANAKKISDLSPELKAANKAYADLMDFQKNEGIRRILNKQNNIDSASSALKNYNSTVTKGNTNRNIQDLEKILTDNGYSPFINNIDDVNAAMDLLTQPKTGRNFLGAQTLAKGLVIPALKAIRTANRKGIPNNIKELVDSVRINQQKVMPLLGSKAGTNLLYGDVEYNNNRN